MNEKAERAKELTRKRVQSYRKRKSKEIKLRRSNSDGEIESSHLKNLPQLDVNNDHFENVIDSNVNKLSSIDVKEIG